MEGGVWCLPPARHEKLANLDARQRKITQNCQLCLLGSPKIGASRWRAWTSSCQNLRPAERGSLWTASTANQSPRVQSLPMPCGKGPLSAGLSRLSWAGEPGREQRVRHLPHHFSGGGFRGQCCPAVPARTPAPPSGLGVAVDCGPPWPSRETSWPEGYPNGL